MTYVITSSEETCFKTGTGTEHIGLQWQANKEKNNILISVLFSAFPFYDFSVKIDVYLTFDRIVYCCVKCHLLAIYIFVTHSGNLVMYQKKHNFMEEMKYGVILGVSII